MIRAAAAQRARDRWASVTVTVRVTVTEVTSLRHRDWQPSQPESSGPPAVTVTVPELRMITESSRVTAGRRTCQITPGGSDHAPPAESDPISDLLPGRAVTLAVRDSSHEST
jgi:hypothetical protein